MVDVAVNFVICFLLAGTAHCRYVKTVRIHLASFILPSHST